MNIATVIEHLRLHCTYFEKRIAGAAEFKMLEEDANLCVPAAYVIPTDDEVGERLSKNDIYQNLTEPFSVVVAVSNTPDERGQAAIMNVKDVARAALWKALLGWQPDGLGGESRYPAGIYYEGSSLLGRDRSRLWYQFDFAADMQIMPEDGYQKSELDNLPHFDGANVNVDYIDPAYDPNLVPPNQHHGPDGRIEHIVKIPKTGNLP